MGHIKYLLTSDLLDRNKTHLIYDSLIQFNLKHLLRSTHALYFLE